VLNTKNTSSNQKCRLSNSHLDAKLLSASVEIAVRRAHIYSLNCGDHLPHNNVIKTRELNRIRDIMNLYRELVLAMEKNAMEGGNNLQELNIAALGQQIAILFEEMIPILELEQAEKMCTPTEFFVALTAEVRSAGSKTQRFLGKLERIEENSINKKLSLLKEQYEVNSKKISELENRLKIKKDNLLREKLRDIKIFECLNAEKPTPLLLGLVKKN
jgi:hypothetical protein